MELETQIIRSGEKVGISGSHGLIGSNLVNRLKDLNVEVTSLDREGNVPKGITRIFDGGAYGNIYGQDNIPEIHRANVDRVMKLLTNAELDTPIVLISSSSVLLNVETPYSKSKEEMEKRFKDYVSQTGEPVVVARPSTIVGVGENEKHLIPTLIDHAFTGKVMDFIGEPTHDFLSVDDFCNALILLSNKAEKYKGQIFNVSFGVSLSNDDILKVVQDVTQRKININRVKSLRPYDTKHWEVPNDKIRGLGWHPTKTVIDVIEEMVKDYKQKNNI